MCYFFSAIVLRNGDVKFTEKDSHAEVIRRLELDDSSLHTRFFVRVECNPPFNFVSVDETSSPTWWEEESFTYEDRVRALARKVQDAIRRRGQKKQREKVREKIAALRLLLPGLKDEASVEYQRLMLDARKEMSKREKTIRREFAPSGMSVRMLERRLGNVKSWFDAQKWRRREQANRKIVRMNQRIYDLQQSINREGSITEVIKNIHGYVPE